MGFESSNKKNLLGSTVVQSEPVPGHVMLHFSTASLDASINFVIIDISDTGTYKHRGTDFIHGDWLDYQVQATTNALYSIDICFLNNITVSGSDCHKIFSIQGTKKAGQDINRFINPGVNGPQCHVSGTATRVVFSPAFHATASIKSVLNGFVAPGQNDLVAVVTIEAGSIAFTMNMGYHAE